jgi:transcriptional regulator with XRE-family HTH domain
MPTRQRRGDLGVADARRLRVRVGTELRDARIGAGISQTVAAHAAGISRSQLGRLERGEIRRPNFEQACRAARGLGLSLAVRLYPVGRPVRDAAQLALLSRFEACLGPGLKVRREAPLPIEGDLRAWDAIVQGGERPFFADAESRLGDIQELTRRLELKLRDDPRSNVMILVVQRSVHNRRILELHREALRPLLPQDAASILRHLRAGRVPVASGIVVL